MQTSHRFYHLAYIKGTYNAIKLLAHVLKRYILLAKVSQLIADLSTITEGFFLYNRVDYKGQYERLQLPFRDHWS